MAHLDGAAVKIKTEIRDLESTADYIWDKCTQEDFGGAQQGDKIQILDLDDFTVNADADSTSITPDTPAANSDDLIVDLHPGIVVHLQKRQSHQMMGGGGNWAKSIGMKAARQMRNYMDKNLLGYLWSLVDEDSAATYTENIAGAAVTQKMFDDLESQMLDTAGVTNESNIAWILSPWMVGAARNLTTWATMPTQPPNTLGLNKIGHINEFPVYRTNNLPGAGGYGAKTAVTTSVVIATNVATITTAAAHNFGVGEKITCTGTTEELTTAAAIASVPSATTLTVPFTATDANPMADSAGLLTSTVTDNYLVNFDHIHVASAPFTDAVIREREASAGHNLILDKLFGRVAHAAPYGVLRICNLRGSVV